MEELILNFLGEEAKIAYPKDIPSLRSQISEKYLLSSSDAKELILYYIHENKKIYIINGNDFSKFKETKNNTIYLDINQNSKLYLDNASKIKKEKSEESKDLKELNELIEKYKVFSKEKEEKVKYYYKELNDAMNEVKKKREEYNRKIHKILSKVYEEDEEYIKKIYTLQRKLNLPTTVRIPKEIKKQEEERINQEAKKKQEEIRKQARLRKEEELKKREERRKEYQEKIRKIMEEDEKKKQIIRLNKLRSTQCCIKSRQDFFPHISFRKMEEDKRKAAFKCRTIAAATAAKFIAARKKENSFNEEKLKTSYEILEPKNKEMNTVPVFNEVNKVLNKTVEQVKEVAKECILKGAPKKDDKKEIEKEKKAQIEKIQKITKEAVKEINKLTKMVIEQSNDLIEKINNPEINLLSSNDNDDNLILKSTKKDIKKKEGIHFHVKCDGCKMDPIRGNRYKCKVCPDFDFCEKCYQSKKEEHGHEFKVIEKPKNTKRMGHKNKQYCGRGIVHRGTRCEGCGLEPIVGWRFKCSICEDYNLCENCEERLAIRHNHPLIKLYYSLMQNVFEDCHLKLNSYESNQTK